LIPRAQADKENLFPRGTPRALANPYKGVPAGAMDGTPYAIRWRGFITGLGIPCQRPPYGYLTAIDLKTRKTLWHHPFGSAENSGPFGTALGLPFTLGAPNIGGSVVTAGGVIFIAASQDGYFRAIDEASGRTLWRVKLPAGGHANPMTYMGRDGRQYVLIAAGGNRGFRTGSSDSIIAYRLRRDAS
jgi:quinoprotein glucose dehydrogenase